MVKRILASGGKPAMVTFGPVKVPEPEAATAGGKETQE